MNQLEIIYRFDREISHSLTIKCNKNITIMETTLTFVHTYPTQINEEFRHSVSLFCYYNWKHIWLYKR
jgi:hypothetical protein